MPGTSAGNPWTSYRFACETIPGAPRSFHSTFRRHFWTIAVQPNPPRLPRACPCRSRMWECGKWFLMGAKSHFVRLRGCEDIVMAWHGNNLAWLRSRRQPHETGLEEQWTKPQPTARCREPKGEIYLLPSYCLVSSALRTSGLILGTLGRQGSTGREVSS